MKNTGEETTKTDNTELNKNDNAPAEMQDTKGLNTSLLISRS